MPFEIGDEINGGKGDTSMRGILWNMGDDFIVKVGTELEDPDHALEMCGSKVAQCEIGRGGALWGLDHPQERIDVRKVGE